MTTHDNAPPKDGWRPTARLGRCCGTNTTGLVCDVCGMWIVRT